MQSPLSAKRGKSNLAVGNDLLYHNQKDIVSEPLPKIVPLYDGQELKINQNLIMNGLATISIRNLTSNEFAIKKRNSFFNLHRPELKGLKIIPTENQEETTLQHHILKEVKTIHEIQSMKSLYNTNGSQSSLANGLENKIMSDALLIGNNFQKKLMPLAKTAFDKQKSWAEYSGNMDPDESILETDKFGMFDVEIKSTLMH